MTTPGGLWFRKPKGALAGALLLGALGASMLGCVTVANVLGGGPRLYVAPFSDATPRQEAGYALWEATREAVYVRAPQRFLMVFDDGALALDAEVVEVADEVVPGEQRKRDVVVGATFRLVSRVGIEHHRSGVMQRRGRYDVDGPKSEVVARRQRAKAIAIEALAGALADAALEVSLALPELSSSSSSSSSSSDPGLPKP